MKIFVIILVIAVVGFYFIIQSGKKNIRENKENARCLARENFFLIKDSPFSDELSEYTIHRIDSQLKFTRKGKGYTLFYLKLEKDEAQTVKLVGLDGYGIRDREFLRYVCNLLKEIKLKSKR